MTSKHTPGPWTAEKNTDQSQHIKVIHHSNKPGAATRTIAKVTCRMSWSAEQKANARLIAAAPDLLEELRQAIIQMDLASECIENKRYDEALIHVSSLMRYKRAAIAKATGEGA